MRNPRSSNVEGADGQILSDDRQRPIKIFPSWESEPLAPAKMSPPRGRPSLPPTGPRGDRERQPPAGPSRPAQRPPPPSGPSSSRPAKANGAPPAVTKPLPTSPKIPRTSFPEETQGQPLVQKPVQSRAPSLPAPESPSTPSLLTRISTPAQPQARDGRVELMPSSSKQLQASANGQQPSHMPAQPLPIPESSTAGPSRPTSLADRLGMRTASGSTKRPREELLSGPPSTSSPSTGPSLLSRLGGQADTQDTPGRGAGEERGSKRPRESPKPTSTSETPQPPQPTAEPRRSLLDRLSNGTRSKSPGAAATPSTTPKAFSIMRRSSSQSSLPPAASNPATPATLSIRSQAPAAPSSGLSIRASHSVIHPSIVQTELLPSTSYDVSMNDEEKGVIRKGRGFEAKSAEEVFDFVLPQRPVEVDMEVHKTAGWSGGSQGRTQLVRPGQIRRRSPQKR